MRQEIATPEQRVTFHVTYTPDEGGYNALEPITNTTSWGETLAKAQEMIAEALGLYVAELSSEEAQEIAARQADT